MFFWFTCDYIPHNSGTESENVLYGIVVQCLFTGTNFDCFHADQILVYHCPLNAGFIKKITNSLFITAMLFNMKTNIIRVVYIRFFFFSSWEKCPQMFCDPSRNLI